MSTSHHNFSAEETDRIIQMAWEDRTPFEAIEFQFGANGCRDEAPNTFNAAYPLIRALSAHSNEALASIKSANASGFSD
jgi:hypothetical protein